MVVLRDDRRVVVVVADGAGGLPGGGEAADIAVAAVREAAGRGDTDLTDPRACTALLRTVDELVAADRQAGETTLAFATVSTTGIVGASCGDSGVVVVAADFVDELTRNQRRKLRIGSGRAVPVPFSRPPLDGVLVAATDGLLNYCRIDQLANVVRSHDDDLEAVARHLIDAVRLPSKALVDDVALALVASP